MRPPAASAPPAPPEDAGPDAMQALLEAGASALQMGANAAEAAASAASAAERTGILPLLFRAVTNSWRRRLAGPAATAAAGAVVTGLLAGPSSGPEGAEGAEGGPERAAPPEEGV